MELVVEGEGEIESERERVRKEEWEKGRTNLFGEEERGDRLCKLWVSGCSGKDGEEDDGKMRMKRDGKDRFTEGRKRKRRERERGRDGNICGFRRKEEVTATSARLYLTPRKKFFSFFLSFYFLNPCSLFLLSHSTSSFIFL